MRKRTFIILQLVFLCVFTLWSGISHADSIQGIVDSKHDLSWDSTGSSPLKFTTSQRCVFCHTPHSANADVRSDTTWSSGNTYNVGTGSPLLLWNRALPTLNTGASDGYSLYTSSSMDTSPTQVRVYSLLCLSCHDGVSAVNVLYNMPGDVVGGQLLFEDPFVIPPPDSFADIGAVGTNIGERTASDASEAVNLANDHPVSFNFTSSHQDVGAGLHDPSTISPLVLYPDPSGTPGVSLECSTCHDVHNQGDTDIANGGKYPFLRVTIKGSALCFKCHDK